MSSFVLGLIRISVGVEGRVQGEFLIITDSIPSSDPGQRSSIFSECVDKGYFVKRTNGDVWQW